MSGLNNISLRPFLITDSKSLAKHANNRLIWQNLRDRFPFPYSEIDANHFIQAVSTISPITEFAIDVNGEAIGAAGLLLKDDIYKGNGEIGYWIGQDYWGKGFGTWVVKELTRIAFNEFKLRRVYAKVFENNIASVRILEKNGFVKEATLKSVIVKDGKYLTLNIFSILNPKQL